MSLKLLEFWRSCLLFMPCIIEGFVWKNKREWGDPCRRLFFCVRRRFFNDINGLGGAGGSLRRSFKILQWFQEVRTILNLQAPGVYWTPVSGFRLTFPAGGSICDPLCWLFPSSVALIVLTVYGQRFKRSTPKCDFFGFFLVCNVIT